MGKPGHSRELALELTELIAEEISAQLGVHRRVEHMPALIADAILDAFRVEPAEPWTASVSDLAGSIRLGYDAEANDPNLGFAPPPSEEIDWLAAWMLSEGWHRHSSSMTGGR